MPTDITAVQNYIHAAKVVGAYMKLGKTSEKVFPWMCLAGKSRLVRRRRARMWGRRTAGRSGPLP